MNDGVLSGIVCVIGFVLLASGWKDVLLPGVSARSIGRTVLFVAMMSSVRMELYGILAGGTGLAVLLLAVLALTIYPADWRSWLGESVPVLLLACLVHLAQVYLTLEPMWAIWDSRLDPALAAGLLSVGWASKPVALRLGALGGALALADLAGALRAGSGAAFGGAAYADDLMSALAVSCAVCAMVRRIAALRQRAKSLWNKYIGRPDGNW